MTQGFCIYCRRHFGVSLQVVSFLWVSKIVENWCVIYVQSDIAGETETGKTYRASFNDKQGHTVLVMHPTRQVIFGFCFVLMGLIKVHYLQLFNFGQNLHLQIRGSYPLMWCTMDIFLHVEHKYSSRTNQAVGVFLGECNFEPSWGTGADDLVDWLQRLGT